MSQKPKFAAIAFGLAIGLAGAANAAWQPAKPIEFIATAGPGGGTDNFARAIQNIITIHKLVEQPIVVTNKGGGSGAEGYTYTKAMAGDPYKIVFGTSNAWTQPMVSKVAYNYTDLTPIAAMVQDEFLLYPEQKLVLHHCGNRRQVGVVIGDLGDHRLGPGIRCAEHDLIGIARHRLGVSIAFGAATPALVGDDDRLLDQFVYGDDVLDGTREIIRAAARARCCNEFDRFGWLPRGICRSR